MVARFRLSRRCLLGAAVVVGGLAVSGRSPGDRTRRGSRNWHPSWTRSFPHPSQFSISPTGSAASIQLSDPAGLLSATRRRKGLRQMNTTRLRLSRDADVWHKHGHSRARAHPMPRKEAPSTVSRIRAVASAGPIPGISSSRRLVSLDRCQALIIRSNSRIRSLSSRSWAPSAARHARATSGTRLSLGSATTSSSSSTPLPDRRDDPELGKMGTDRIDHRSLLANHQVTGAMQHQAALLLGRFGLDEPHVCSGDRFADGLGVSCIVFLSLDVGLHIRGRHQAYRVPERLQFARPVM